MALATSLLPFYPQGVSLGLAALAALAALADPRAGLVVALAVPILPAGDVSLGLAAVYVPAALAWTVVHWRDPRHSLLFLAGPLLALAALLPLLPLLAARAAGPLRRALQAGAGVVVAALVAGLRGASLPFDGAPAPLGLGIEGSESPGAVASALLSALTAHPLVAVEAALLALAAVAIPAVRTCAGLEGHRFRGDAACPRTSRASGLRRRHAARAHIHAGRGGSVRSPRLRKLAPEGCELDSVLA